MRTFARLLILVLGLITATSAFFAVQQQKAVRTARSAAEALEKERTALRNQLLEAERQRQELEARLRTNTSAGDGVVTIQTETGEFTIPAGDTPRNGRPDVRGLRGNIAAALDTPEAQRLMALQQRGALDSNYADLFKRLNLTPAQLDQFKNLLVEKRTAVSDVLAAARSQGLNGRESRDEIRALMQVTQEDIDDNIRRVLGESAYNQYQQYERTAPQRALTNQLEQRLSYTSAPLTAQQSDRLVQILAANSPSTPSGGRAQPAINLATVPPGSFGSGNRIIALGGPTITDAALQQAAGVLNASQMQALRELQAEQQAQAQLSQIMRNQFQPRRAGAQGEATSTAPSASSATPPKG